jgi:hypothetical protein
LIAEAEASVADWPTDWPIDETDDRPGAAQLLFYHYADSAQFGRLGDLFGRITASPRSDHQRRFGTLAGLDTLAALHFAAWASDPVRARALLERVPQKATIRANSIWHAAWAAVHLAEGNRSRAAGEARTARRLLRRFGLRSGGDRAEQRWIETVLSRSEAPIVGPIEPAEQAVA